MSGLEKLTITAGEIVRRLGLQNRTPAVCSVLRSLRFQKESGLVLESQEGPPSGQSTTMKYTYRLVDGSPEKEHPLYSLRGVGKETFGALGGAEYFIREERKGFEG